MLGLLVPLLIILNPLTTIPAYLAMRPHTTSKQHTWDAAVIALGALCVLGVAAVGGQGLLQMFGLEIDYFRIAGGLVIGWVAWSMTQGNFSNIIAAQDPAKSNTEDTGKMKIESGLIVPLVIPMTSGPGSIAYIITQSGTASIWQLLIAVVCASAVVFIAIRFGSMILEKLGDVGIKVMMRIMGIIMLGIALQMIIGTILKIIA